MELKDISGVANRMTMKKVGGKQQQQKQSIIRVNLAPKRKLRETGTQTENNDHNDDVDLITGDEPPRKYSRLQSEAREKMIHQLLEENEKLQNKIEFLEKENFELESMLDDAKKLAEMISSMPDDPDESGIVRDHPDDD